RRALRHYGGPAGELVDGLASAIQEFQINFALRPALEPVVDHSAAGRVLANPRGAAAAAAAASTASEAISRFRLEQVRLFSGDAVSQLVEQGHIVEHIEGPPLCGHHQFLVALVKRDVRDGSHWNIQIEWPPVLAGVVGNV